MQDWIADTLALSSMIGLMWIIFACSAILGGQGI